MSVAKNAANVLLQPARNCRKHHRALALLAAALQSGHFARKLVGATTRLFAGGQPGSSRARVVATLWQAGVYANSRDCSQRRRGRVHPSRLLSNLR